MKVFAVPYGRLKTVGTVPPPNIEVFTVHLKVVLAAEERETRP